ncbi:MULTISPECIES: PspA/IM30 family protein [unclassified Leisingera]|uniref:PspA/IM30 family protein n=1 Tax=unclassified Leisingera TaxID=2614906 RepID=UPI0013E90BF2|nr:MULTISPECIES: PspA/IM30 family protein [unclassified Leisingera]MBQ4825027.1 PspA/IM30 family protein [Leisingera sp. HS039]
MFATLKTLITGANARAEEQLRETYSIELITQKIREAEGNLKAAKLTLASLIQRQRAELRQIETLQTRVHDLMARAGEALEGGREDLAQSAAQAVAEMENELTVRRQTLDRLDTRILQLRQSVETASRRITDLKQGAIAARATRREQDIQRRLRRHTGGDSPAEEAEALISEVLQRDDPFEQGEILREIDGELNSSSIADDLADAGFGPRSRSTAADVLNRLKAKD